MTDRIAIVLVVLLAALLVADRLWLGWNLPVVLGRQFVAFVESLAIWR